MDYEELTEERFIELRDKVLTDFEDDYDYSLIYRDCADYYKDAQHYWWEEKVYVTPYIYQGKKVYIEMYVRYSPYRRMAHVCTKD